MDSRLLKVIPKATILPKIDVLAVVVQALASVLVLWVLWLAAAVLTSYSDHVVLQKDLSCFSVDLWAAGCLLGLQSIVTIRYEGFPQIRSSFTR